MLTIKNPALGKQSNETGFFIFPTASGMIQANVPMSKSATQRESKRTTFEHTAL